MHLSPAEGCRSAQGCGAVRTLPTMPSIAPCLGLQCAKARGAAWPLLRAPRAGATLEVIGRIDGGGDDDLAIGAEIGTRAGLAAIAHPRRV
ncbi:MAG: hypothetical protein AAFO79_06680 [Pseudomonadota bacterium]